MLDHVFYARCCTLSFSLSLAKIEYKHTLAHSLHSSQLESQLDPHAEVRADLQRDLLPIVLDCEIKSLFTIPPYSFSSPVEFVDNRETIGPLIPMKNRSLSGRGAARRGGAACTRYVTVTVYTRTSVKAADCRCNRVTLTYFATRLHRCNSPATIRIGEKSRVALVALPIARNALPLYERRLRHRPHLSRFLSRIAISIHATRSARVSSHAACLVTISAMPFSPLRHNE